MLDMYGFIDATFDPLISVSLIKRTSTIVDGKYIYTDTQSPLNGCHIATAGDREVEHLSEGMTEPRVLMVVHINDGTMLYPNDDGSYSDLLMFDAGRGDRTWRVIKADSRPWRNFCRAIVELMPDD